MLRSRAALAAVAALAVSLGCPGDDGGVGNVLVVGSVEVTPGITTVVLGGTTQLSAAPKTTSGIAVPGRSVSWSSTDAAKASVSQTGLVTGHALGGPVRIRATVDGVTGDALITVQPVPVNRVTVAPSDSPILVGGTVQLTATAFDAAGAPLSGRSFLWESSAPNIAAVTSTGVVIGQAQGGPVTITATTEGKSGTATVSVSTRPATRLTFATQPGPSTAGAPLNPAIRIALQDDLLTTVIGASNAVTIALAGNLGDATLGGTLTAAPVNGIATFGNLTLNRVGAGYTFQVTSPGLQSATSAPFNVAAGPAAQFTFVTAPPGAGQSGVPLAPQPVLQLRDASGNVVQQAAVQVTATIASGTGTLGGVTTVATNAAGVATFGNLAIVGATGSYTLGFGSPGLATLISGPIVLGSGAAAALSITTQPSSAAQNAVPLAQQPAVQLRDAAGNPVSQAGVVVTASLASGTGTLGGASSATTNASGLATFSSLAINGAAGLYTLQFSAPGVTSVVSTSIALGAGTQTQLALTVQPSSTAQVGVPFPQQPSVQLRDASNNPVASGGGGVPITATASVGGTLLGTTVVATNASGVAAFTGLALSGPAGNYTITFSSPGLDPAISSPIALSAGPAAQLAVTRQPPSGAQSGVAFPAAQQPQVQIQDAAGNPVASAGVSITAALTAGSGGTLGGTLTASTNGTGLATFSNLAITGPSGTYTIRFTSAAPVLTAAVSNGVTLGAGSATTITISTQPSAAAQSGAVFGQQPAALVRDAANNPVAGVVVTASVTGAPAGVSLTGTLTATTNASGVANFAGLGLTGIAGSYTLTFTSGALSSVPSNTIVLSAGTATQLSYNQQPSTTATSGIAFAQQPILLLRDASNNPVPGAVVTATVTGAPAGVTLIGTVTATTSASGIAAFAGLGLSGASGSHTLTFTSGTVTSPASNTIVLSAGTATQLTYNTQPPASATSGAAFTTAPVLLLRDGSNNPVGSTVVTATITGSPAGASFVGTASATTNASGLATFTGLGLSGPAGNYTLTFTSGAVTSAASNTIAVGAGAATQLTYNQQPSTTANSGQAFVQQPILLLRDAANNPVGSALVTATITGAPAGASLVGTVTATTNAAGAATFAGSGLGLSGPVGSYTLTFTAGAVSSPASNAIALSAGTATQLSYSTQPPASATSGVAFATAPVLLLRDAANNPVGSTVITATITGSPAGVAFVGTATATTNGSGLATFTGLGLSGPAGNYTLTFTAGAVTSAASNTIALAAGGGTQLTYNQQPSTTANSGQAFAQQPILLLRDASNNPIGSAVVTATITGAPAGATLVGTVTATTNGAGIATFVGSGLGISGPVGNYTLTFVSGAATSVASNTIALSAGTATQLTYSVQPPASATSGAAFGTAPVLLLRDAANNPIGSTLVTATITGAPAGVSFVGTPTATTNGAGQATFTGLGLTGPTGNYTLTFTAGAVTSAASNTIALSAGGGTQLTYNQQPSTTANSGQAFAQQPILLLRDASNNPVGSALVTATITGAPAGASLVGTVTVTTNGAGIATFVGSGLGINGPVGNYTLTFSSGAATSAASNTIALSAGTATQLTYNTQPSASATSGAAFGTPPVLLLRDAANNPVGGAVVTATITGSPAGVSFVGTASATTNGSGLATFTGLGLSGPAGSYTLTFTAGAVTSAASNAIALSAGGGTQLTYTQQPSATANSGQAFAQQPILLLRDASNNPIGSAIVTATITGTPPGASLVGTVTATTNASGIATFVGSGLGISGPVGSYTLTFTSGAATSVASNTIALSAGSATQLTYSQQPSISAQSGVAFAQQPILQLRDASNNPVSQVSPVTATITGAPAGVSFVGTTIVSTNASGQVTFSGLGLSGPAGSYTLTFTTGAIASPASNTIALSAGGASQLTYNQQPSTTANSGQAFAQQPILLLRDGSNNPIGSTGVTATITGAPAGVSLIGTVTVTTNASGVATFVGSGLGLSGTVGSYTLTFTAGAVSSSASNTIALSPGTATQLTYNTQPSTTATSGQAFAAQPVLLLRDAANNPVGLTVVTATITGAPPGVSLVGTATATTNGSGLATFSGLGLSGPVGNYTLTFTAGAVTSAASNTIALTAGTPSQLTYNTQPSTTANSGAAFATQPVLLLRDGANNPVGSTLVTATITGAPAGVSLIGTTTATTNGSGLATFSGLGLSGPVGNYTLTFTAGAVTSAGSNTIALSTGAPTQLTYNTQPSTTVASGAVFAQQPVLLLRDSGNNPIGSTVVTASITGAPAGVSFVGTPTATTTGSGVATFSGLGLSGPAGSYTLTFTSGAATSAASNSIAVTAGAPTQLTYNTQPSSTATSGQAFATQPALLLRDAANNPVGLTVVTATITGSPAGVTFVGTASASTNGAGLATFSGLGLSGPAGSYSLTFTSGAVTSAASNSIALSAGGGTQLTYNQQPSTTANSAQAFAQQPILLLRDASNNPVGSAVVTATITGSPAGASLVGSVTATTNGSGVATFVNLGLSGPVGNYTLTFTAGAATSAASNTIALSAGTATQLTYNTQPSTSATTGVAFAQQPVLLLRDAANNPVGSTTVTATITGSPAGVSFVGTTTVTTDAAGIATFVGSGLGLSGPAGNYTLTFTAGAVTSAASNTIALSAGGGTQLTYNQQPSTTANSGQAFAQQPILLLRDASNNPVGSAVVTATITGSPAGASLIGTVTATTNGAGIATFVGSGLGINGPVGNYTLTFTSGAATSVASNTIALSAGSATQLTYNTQPSTTATSGAAFAQQPVLLLRDAANNPVGSTVVTATITGAPAGASLVGTVTATTNGAGIATFVGSGLGLSGPVGNYTLTFTSGAATSATSNTIALSAGTPTQLTYNTQPSATANSSQAFATQPVLLLRDAQNNPIGSTVVTATITGAPAGVTFVGTPTATTDGFGLATFSGLGLSGPVGNYSLTFTAGAVTSAASNTIALAAGSATQLTYTQQPSTTANSGQAFAQQPILLLQDASNNPVGSAIVTATITGSPAGASLVGTVTATTDGAGIATFVGSGLGINGLVGNYTLTFTSGAATSAASNTIALSAGTPSQLTYNTQPSATANSGQPFATQPVLLLRDAGNNPIGSTVVTATITGAPAGVTFVGTATATTDGFGLATFSGLGLSGPVGNYTLTFTAAAVSSAASNTIALAAGSATQLTYTQQPSSTANSGQAFVQQPILLLRDASNNPVGSTVVTATITGAPAGSSLVGTVTATTDGAGIATFVGSGLGINGPVGNYTLTFTSGAATSAASNTIALSAGTPAQLTYNTQPSTTANSGQAFATQPVLLLRDAANNPIGSTVVTATITGAPAGVSFVGTPTATTDGSGLATFSGLGLSGPAGNYTLTFTSGAATSAASNTIALSAGTATKLTITTQPSASATTATPFPQQPLIQLRDAADNPVTTSGVSVTAALNVVSGAGTLAGTVTVTTDSFGSATFTDLQITGAGTFTLTFTSAGLTQVVSITITVS